MVFGIHHLSELGSFIPLSRFFPSLPNCQNNRISYTERTLRNAEEHLVVVAVSIKGEFNAETARAFVQIISKHFYAITNAEIIRGKNRYSLVKCFRLITLTIASFYQSIAL